MMRYAKILLLALVGLLFTSQAKASHLLGGEIYWECAQNGDYIFTLVLYRDCTGINPPPGPETIDGPQGSISAPRISLTDVSPTCPDPNAQLDCSAGDEGAIEKAVYQSSPVSLSGTPPPNGWEFSWNSCCRPGLENTNTGGYYLRAKMYPYTPPGASQPLNTSTCYDNSPQFDQDANGVTCEGFKYTFNHLPSDKDIDSLVFNWADPLQGAGNPIAWSGGYSSAAPFPDASENPSNGPNTLDPESGEMTTEVYNPASGWYASCVKISEYRCGQLIGEVYRDVPFHFLAPSQCNVNASKPTVEIDTSVYPFMNRNGNVYRTSVFPDDTVKFRLTGKDLDQFSDGTFQSITMKAGGLQINSSSPNSQTGCNGAAPCATLTSLNPSGGFTNTIQNTVEFFWIPQCVHLNFGGCGSATNTYFFTIKMQDDGCSANKIGLATIIVQVLAGKPEPPRFTCVNKNRDGTVTLSWDPVQMDSALQILGFNYYKIYGASSPNGPFTVVDSITNRTTSSTTVPSQGQVSYFYIRMSTGPCDFLSRKSPIRRNMTLTMNPVPQGSPERADLSWTPYSASGNLPAGASEYEIWKEIPAGSGNWQLAGTTPNTNYVDTVQVCNRKVGFQIRVPDTVANCFSGSTIDTGTFEDKTNKKNVYLRRATVQNGKAALDFNTDSVDDIVAFQLLYNDPQNGWILVDTIPAGSPSPYAWPGSQADSRSEEVKLVSLDSCGNASDDLAATEHKTIHLRNYLDKCEGTSKLSWNTYEGFPTGADGYNLYVQITEGNGNVLPRVLLFEGGPTDTTYLQRSVDRENTYCYTVEAYDTVQGITTSSNELCVQPQVLNKSDQLYIAQVTNDNNRGSITLNTYIDGEADVKDYQIERAQSYYGPYQSIATIAKPAQPPYIINFQDFGVKPDRQVYYYRVSATDSCGGRDTVSNISRNLRVRGTEQGDLTNRLVWNSYRDWLGHVARYEIYRKKADGSSFEKVGETQKGDTIFLDFDMPDLLRQNPDVSKYCYYVKAVEGSNPQGLVTNTGQPYFAKSNEVCLQQGARAFIPNAFRPQSNVVGNQQFGPEIAMEDVDRFHFYIVNRWGKRIFETKDPEQKWDGTHNNGNEAAPAGTYLYYVEYATPEGIEKSKQGSFMLIR
ncbi:MAG: gliding motility-associated C-terminal domain-containing protein [Schleiferiaceae bacterium]|nr:gliding motility-associated C-terminal domain-containing protein [Schleiferiaceae bacterium]